MTEIMRQTPLFSPLKFHLSWSSGNPSYFVYVLDFHSNKTSQCNYKSFLLKKSTKVNLIPCSVGRPPDGQDPCLAGWGCCSWEFFQRRSTEYSTQRVLLSATGETTASVVTALLISKPQNYIFSPCHAIWLGEKSPRLCSLHLSIFNTLPASWQNDS